MIRNYPDIVLLVGFVIGGIILFCIMYLCGAFKGSPIDPIKTSEKETEKEEDIKVWSPLNNHTNCFTLRINNKNKACLDYYGPRFNYFIIDGNDVIKYADMAGSIEEAKLKVEKKISEVCGG